MSQNQSRDFSRIRGLWVHGAEEQMPEVTPEEMTEIISKIEPLCGEWPSRHSDRVGRETQR